MLSPSCQDGFLFFLNLALGVSLGDTKITIVYEILSGYMSIFSSLYSFKFRAKRDYPSLS